jgi:hypothetical protein
MGKNPNAKRLKENKHKEKSYDNDLDSLNEEAARLGCEVWEVEKYRQIEKDNASSSEEDDSDKDIKPKTKATKLQVIEETKQVVKQEEEDDDDDEDSDDRELAKLYGLTSGGNKKGKAVVESDEEDDQPKKKQQQKGKQK